MAVVLAYLENIKEKTAIGQIQADDPRLLQLDAPGEAFDKLVEFEGFDIEVYEEDLEDYEEEEKADSHPGRSKSKHTSLRTYLQEHTKAELVSLVEELASEYDEVRQLLADRRTLASGQTRKILQTVRREISALEEPVWDDYGYGVSTARVDRLEAALKALVEAGQTDAVVRLGPELLAVGSQVVEPRT